MAYSQTSWASGDTVSKTRLNNMESGIANAALQADVQHLPGVTTTYDNAGAHNSIFRGASLGTSITSTQASNISSGKFTGLYIGDYWTINSIRWRIAAFDYWYQCGETMTTTHHAVIVPDTTLYNAPMNASSTAAGAYAGSAMFACEDYTVSSTTYTGLADAISAVQSAFGDYVLTHDAYLANAVTSGVPSAQAWYTDRVCDLMTEQMVFGGPVMQQMSYGGSLAANRRVEKLQLPLFALAPQYIHIKSAYWLQDVASTTYFTHINYYGLAYANGAATVIGVRPYFLIS